MGKGANDAYIHYILTDLFSCVGIVSSIRSHYYSMSFYYLECSNKLVFFLIQGIKIIEAVQFHGLLIEGSRIALEC